MVSYQRENLGEKINCLLPTSTLFISSVMRLKNASSLSNVGSKSDLICVLKSNLNI